jgi:hypothetical protein
MVAKRIAENKAEALQQQVEGSRRGVDLDACEWLDPELTSELKSAITSRQEIQLAEGRLKKRKADANATIAAVMGALDIDTASVCGVGSVSKYSQTRTTLDQDALKEILLSKGVPAEVIVESWERASKSKTIDGVRFSTK